MEHLKIPGSTLILPPLPMTQNYILNKFQQGEFYDNYVDIKTLKFHKYAKFDITFFIFYSPLTKISIHLTILRIFAAFPPNSQQVYFTFQLGKLFPIKAKMQVHIKELFIKYHFA